jgi:integrase
LGKVFGFSIRRDPAIGPVLAGIERTHGVRQDGKDALLLEDLQKLLEVLPDSGNLLHLRDRALLLLGFAGAFRRSELAALEVDDLQFRDEGLVVLVRRSKTDPEGAGRKVGIPFGASEATCPVRGLRAWLDKAVIRTGAVFRRVYGGRTVGEPLEPQAVWLVIKRVCAAAGLDPERFGAHSLRAGMVTQAIRGGASDHAIMAQTGHKSSDMVRRYRRETDLFQDNAGGKLGL